MTVNGDVVSLGHLHGNLTTHDREGVFARTGKAVDIPDTHHALKSCQIKIPSLIASSTDLFILDRNSLKNDVLGTTRWVLTGPCPPDARDIHSRYKENRRDHRRTYLGVMELFV